MLKVEHTTRAYTGKPGCMCGCNGTYNEGERARKLAITQMLKDPRAHLQVWNNNEEGCIYFLPTGNRNRVLYLNKAGVSVALTLGLKQEAN
jgi:hypothetical protein